MHEKMWSTAVTEVLMFPFLFKEPNRRRNSQDAPLIGLRAICEFLGIGANTLYAWMRNDFPVVRLPDSHHRYATTPRLITQWLKDMRKRQKAAVESGVKAKRSDPQGDDS